MLKIFHELTEKIQDLVIEVDEFETVSILGCIEDIDENINFSGDSLETALASLTQTYKGVFPNCEKMLTGGEHDQDPTQSVHLEPIREIGIDHPLFSEIRFDLDRCIRRGIDSAEDDISVAIPLKIIIKRNPFSRANQVSHTISLNITQKKHASKGKIRDFGSKYDESGHLIVFDEQMEFDDLPQVKTINQLDQTAIEESPADNLSNDDEADPFDNIVSESQQEERIFGGLIRGIWNGLAVGSEIRLMNQDSDIHAVVIGFIDQPIGGKHEWVLKVTNDAGEEEIIQQHMVDILVWCSHWYYRELPESEKQTEEQNLLEGL